MKKISMGDKDYEYKKIKQELQIEDLNRYGIFTYLVDDYNEITRILQIIVNNYRRKTIFISGSADDYGDFTNEQGKTFLHLLSKKLAEKDYHIVNGYGKGIGDLLLSGVSEYCLARNKKILDCLTIMPFPQSISKEMYQLYNKNRIQMIEKCGIAIFVFGNKKGKGAEGVMEEFNISKKMNLSILPISCTGSAAMKISNEILSARSIDKDNLKAIQIANRNVKNNVKQLVENIIKAIEFLNKEED
ncbi:hypothetical protein [Mycoplasma capricolum]|uniref:hypothetical protein n=1 Tax=Mycoplasma capricolum TaxID=2095 RepID=UPI001E519788|nr:hypothetical protein [Mycoplasma capricolum]